uniref:GTPase IMAP family member 8-like n=1 Tax=Seriola lalandi dorsalis TaxID=1841481 RepID=A0A3B4X6D5_SERLL
MENNPEEKESITLPEVRLILIGGRWAGKSSSGNTILRRERFECGQTRTAQSEVRHEIVEGRKLIVVDAPGWKSSLSLTHIPEWNKQQFKLNLSRCPPGPQVFLLVIPIDSAFSVAQKRIVEEHMKLLGEGVWRYTMVLFTCGDYLGGKTIEQHIESEGDALKWLIERCKNRYHVINNKEKSNSSQVTLLLQKIDEIVSDNNGSYYEVDEQTLTIIEKKQREVAERAEKRRRRAEEQRQQMTTLIQGDLCRALGDVQLVVTEKRRSEKMESNLEEKESITLPEVRLILIGGRWAGKSSSGNTILRKERFECGRTRTAQSEVRHEIVEGRKLIVVDAPGWNSSLSLKDIPEGDKQRFKLNPSRCPPGPQVFLLVIPIDSAFSVAQKRIVEEHMKLLGERVWRYTMVLFTCGDYLGGKTIEQHIESEGDALKWLIERCKNSYHVINNKEKSNSSQVTLLLQKIDE